MVAGVGTLRAGLSSSPPPPLVYGPGTSWTGVRRHSGHLRLWRYPCRGGNHRWLIRGSSSCDWPNKEPSRSPSCVGATGSSETPATSGSLAFAETVSPAWPIVLANRIAHGIAALPSRESLTALIILIFLSQGPYGLGGVAFGGNWLCFELVARQGRVHA